MIGNDPKLRPPSAATTNIGFSIDISDLDEVLGAAAMLLELLVFHRHRDRHLYPGGSQGRLPIAGYVRKQTDGEGGSRYAPIIGADPAGNVHIAALGAG